MPHFITTLCFIAMCASFALAQTGERPIPENLIEINNELSMAFETPHTKWAKPYALGKTRILFMAPWYQGSTDGREMIELMQRFDLDAYAFHILGGATLSGDGDPRWYKDAEAGTKRFDRLTEEPFDVFFINRVEFDGLPDRVKSKIEEQVENGSGLVISGEVSLPAFVTGEGKAVSDDPRDGTSYSIGEGRVIQLPEREKLEFDLGWETRLDHQMARQGRAILRAANREPKLKLDIKVPSATIARDELPQSEIEITWSDPASSIEIRLETRHSDGERHLLGVRQSSEKGTTTLSLPPLPAGEYHLDAIATSVRGVENWATASFKVVSDRRIASMGLENDWGEVGEIISVTAELEGDIQSSDHILLKVFDKNGRVLVRKDDKPTSGKAVEFDFEIEPWMPMLLWVEIALVDTYGEVTTRYTPLRVTKRNQNQFNFVMWNAPSGDLAPYGVQSMAEKGVTALLQGGQPPLMLSESNIPFVPYASSFRASSHTTTAMLDENGVLKRGCINDEETMNEFVRQTVERHLPSRQHGTLFYSLGDENAVRGSCLSDHCLYAYRDYLKEQYGDISSLNEEWESDYQSFDEITLLTEGDLPTGDAPQWFKTYFAYRTEKNITDNEGTGEAQVKMGDINDEMRALQNANFARWYDRAAFQNANYLKWCNRFVKAFRQIDPKSLTGFEGTDSFTIRKLTTRSRQGGDLDAFVREMEFFGPYEGPANEVVRSIQPKGYYAGNWIGYSMLANQLLEGYWAVVLNGMNTVQWWRWDNLQGYHGFIAPSFDVWPAGKELLEDTQVVRDGLGDLLMECEIQDDGIAMLYSLPSTYIAHFDGNDTYGLYKRDHKIWYEAIHDAGMQFDYVTDRMLRLGEFDIDHYNVLVLPFALAIGDKEAEVIREFVEEGGTVIADIRPGTYTDHCKPREKGVLDDLFGIERQGKLDAFEIDRMRVGGEVGGTPVSMEWGNWHGVEIYPQMKVDPAVRATTGKPLGLSDLIHFWDMKRPVCVVNEVGKGRAILLNFSVYNAPFEGLLEDLLASAGSTPKIEVADPEGESIPGLEITRWKNGDIELVSLMGRHEGQVQVTLQENQFVYDLKKGLSFGQVGTFETEVRPVRPSIFALFNREAPGPQVKLETESIEKGATGKASIRVPGAVGKHALKVTSKTSMGEEADWIKDIFILGGGTKEISLPIAHNDPEGTWTLSVRDLYTGLGTESKFRVEP